MIDENKYEIPSWLVSSTGEGIALRVKSTLTGLAGAIVLVSALIGKPIDGSEVDSIIEAVTTILSGFTVVVSAIYFVIGWVRRNYLKKNSLGKFSKSL